MCSGYNLSNNMFKTVNKIIAQKLIFNSSHAGVTKSKSHNRHFSRYKTKNKINS